ncbi:hypothetical protein QX25_17780 (plasmid) [Stutzerimonas stutzeri]|nr:hypothetical protein QX25_17780 [Stutzerimonas stutzeri]
MASTSQRRGSRKARIRLRFSKAMILAILVALVIALKLSMNLAQSRTLPADYDTVDEMLASLQTEVQVISRLDVLPKLEQSWRTASSIAGIAGVGYTNFEAAADADVNRRYSGPLKHWNAQLEGSPRPVIAVAKAIQARVPAFLYDYAISGGVMKLNITVVGN